MNRYAYHIDLTNPNSSHSRLIEWTGSNKRVLDVGCGRGQVGRILSEKFGCQVTGIEANSEFANECVGYRQVIVGSLEDESLLRSMAERFDVIICSDVLEHLREPEIPLRAFRDLLTSEGQLLISVPNVAQFRIRLMLLRGRWSYTPEGIMDVTHMRWFTRSTLRDLVARCGWKEMEFDYILGPNFGRWLQRFHIPKSWAPPTLLGTQFLLRLALL